MPTSLLSRPWQSWLLDNGSLTAALKALAPGHFQVQVLRTHFARPYLSEAQALHINPRQQVYIREVALKVKGRPLVYARSVIPRQTLSGAERQLLWLKNKPLGELLFKHKHMRRSAIQCKQGRVNDLPCHARRSVFRLNEKPLLVSEHFLADIFNA